MACLKKPVKEHYTNIPFGTISQFKTYRLINLQLIEIIYFIPYKARLYILIAALLSAVGNF